MHTDEDYCFCLVLKKVDKPFSTIRNGVITHSNWSLYKSMAYFSSIFTGNSCHKQCNLIHLANFLTGNLGVQSSWCSEHHWERCANCNQCHWSRGAFFLRCFEGKCRYNHFIVLQTSYVRNAWAGNWTVFYIMGLGFGGQKYYLPFVHAYLVV